MARRGGGDATGTPRRVWRIIATAPRATESFKWAQPVYESNGPLAYIKAHVTLGFWRGANRGNPAIGR